MKRLIPAALAVYLLGAAPVQADDLKLSRESATAVVQYLAGRPYGEVYQLISTLAPLIQALQVPPAPEAKPEDKPKPHPRPGAPPPS